MNNNTLYITFDGLSDPLGQSQILPYLTGIAQNEFKITILSCEKSNRLKNQKENLENLLKSYHIDWKYIIYDEEAGFLSRLGYIRKIASIARLENSLKKFQIVHCRSYLSALIGMEMKQKHNCRFIFDMRGFWADERLDGGIWSKKNLHHLIFYTYFKRKEKQFLRSADAVVSLTQNALTYLSNSHPRSNIIEKTTVIPCCVNTKVFDPANVDFLHINGVSSADHVLIYTGSIGTWYYTQEMIDCISVWKTLIPNIKLLIVTHDTDKLNAILERCTEEQRKIIVPASASFNKIPSYLNIAKAAIFFIKPAFSKIASSPTKMAECWAMNLPIITNAGIGDNDLYFRGNAGGLLIHDFTNDQYLQAGQTYLELLERKQNYRLIAKQHFNLEKAIIQYTCIYRAVTEA